MLCAATPDFSVRYIFFLNVPVKILEWLDGIGFTSWLTFRLSLDFIIWDFSSGLAVSIYGFIPPPISPSLASSCFPVTCTDLTWEGDCSTVGWLQLLFWVCRPGVTLSSYKWLLSCHWPHTRAVLQDVPQSVPGAARFHYLFSHCASKQKSIISASVCPWVSGSTALRKVSPDLSVDSCI